MVLKPTTHMAHALQEYLTVVLHLNRCLVHWMESGHHEFVAGRQEKQLTGFNYTPKSTCAEVLCHCVTLLVRTIVFVILWHCLHKYTVPIVGETSFWCLRLDCYYSHLVSLSDGVIPSLYRTVNNMLRLS